ncbi:MAG: UvrB/UvrC motif-containing protein [Lentisphaeraceae bacterium]|nr:UvrB/UvrC motif-containing protein [Lentisphaeraceae bacterium]
MAFWNKDDDRRKEDSYVSNKRVELEMMRLGEFLKQLFPDAEISIDGLGKESPIDEIRQSDIVNSHIHGPVTGEGLGYIKIHMEKDNYDRNQNSFDRDKKRIVCGELKSFYNNYGILMQGEAWHHINNMWWMLCNGKRYNISSFSLFDYSDDPVRKSQTGAERIKAIEAAKRQAVQAENYEKAAILRDVLNMDKKS